jgi:integrase
MPRRSKGARLYYDESREQWAIRDGQSFVRTGCAQSDYAGAEGRLQEYIGAKYKPAPSPSPLIADMLLVYAKEHLPETSASERAAHNINNLSKFWGRKNAADITTISCKEYAKVRPHSAARRDLEVLRAATNYWHKNHHPLDRVPTIWLPDKDEPREKWLTRDEAKRLRKAAMNTPHLYRFVALGLKTGSRSGVLFKLQWSWINLDSGVMVRRAPGEADNPTKRKPPVRLGKSMVRLLRIWKRQDQELPYVVHFNGRPIESVGTSWDKACADAGIEDVSPHTLRHTRATWMAQAGIDPFEAAGSLGMSVQVYLRTYAKHSPDFQSKAAEV